MTAVLIGIAAYLAVSALVWCVLVDLPVGKTGGTGSDRSATIRREGLALAIPSLAWLPMLAWIATAPARRAILSMIHEPEGR